MSLALISTLLFLAPAAPLVIAEREHAVGQADAAYAELTAHQTEQAIVRLEAALERSPGDPSLLINLGTAYFRANRLDEAREAFRQAQASDERYRVELADGSWEDSRKVARMALDSLDRSVLAAK